jgi:hypothetical protein
MHTVTADIQSEKGSFSEYQERLKSKLNLDSTRSLRLPDAFNIPDSKLNADELVNRRAWEELLQGRRQARYLVSVGFKVHCLNVTGITSMNFFLDAINRDLFKQRHEHKDPTAGLSGACIIEPHLLSKNFYGQMHFHALIDDDPAIENVGTLKAAVYGNMKRVKTKDGWPMLDRNVVDVRSIWDIDGLADYLTKTHRLHRWRTLDNVCFVTPQGLSGFCIEYLQGRNELLRKHEWREWKTY